MSRSESGDFSRQARHACGFGTSSVLPIDVSNSTSRQLHAHPNELTPTASSCALCASRERRDAPSFPPRRRQASIYAVFYVLEVFPTRLQGLDLAVVLMRPTRRHYRLIDRRVGGVPTCRCRPRQSSCSGDMLRQDYAVFELIHVLFNAPAAARFELAGLTRMTCLQHLAFNGATTIFLFNIRTSRERHIPLRVVRLSQSGARHHRSRRARDAPRWCRPGRLHRSPPPPCFFDFWCSGKRVFGDAPAVRALCSGPGFRAPATAVTRAAPAVAPIPRRPHISDSTFGLPPLW
ncbi:hypothetical protein B0H15DRAFT_946215 [Mycena belliarum]|uniref:Uncharacterized protein n=1 Tax=Mycena belliarum TaxID=1033014 RepID=A0AAD6XVZ9_9AGAR|nr:hypothetical protein B0H15DRAFT_946215 [Mycena belliae]